MSREIKFRAWEPLNKNMHMMNFTLWENGMNYGTKAFALPVGEQSLHNAYTSMNLDAIEIMQFTGLKDKNGKDIYEGDILNASIAHPAIGVLGIVGFSQGSFTVDFTKGGANRITLLSERIRFMQPEVGDEVIGNIYENPELLDHH